MPKYPIKIWPKKFEEWTTSHLYPPIPTFPDPPIKNKKHYEGLKYKGRILVSVTVVFFTLSIVQLDKLNVINTLIVIAYLSILIGCYYMIKKIEQLNRSRFDDKQAHIYQSAINKYKQSVNQIKVDWLLEESQINKKYSRFVRRVSLYSFIKCFSQKGSSFDRKPNKGFTEVYFGTFLSDYFQDVIFTDVALSFFDKDEFKIYPDFLLYIKEYNLHIVIEIDEYYSNHDGLPIHYRDNNLSADSANEARYLNANWFVIRFSEFQVISNPLGCCYEINKFLEEILYPKSFNYIEKNLDDISHNCWTYDEALEFAKEEKRVVYEKKLYQIDPFYAPRGESVKNKFNQYESEYLSHDLNNRTELQQLINAIDKVDFDCELESHINNFSPTRTVSDDDLPF